MKYYRVRFGDTLNTLGLKFFGDVDAGLAIYAANLHYIADPNRLSVGQLIIIPREIKI